MDHRNTSENGQSHWTTLKPCISSPNSQRALMVKHLPKINCMSRCLLSILKHVSNARSQAFRQAEEKFDVFTSNKF